LSIWTKWNDAEEIKKRPDIVDEGLEHLEARVFRPGDPLYQWCRYSIGARNGADHRERHPPGETVTPLRYPR
jgi:hypothetical protein